MSATLITVRMIAFAPGGSSSLIPESESTSASETRSARSGSFTVSWLPIRTPGIEPIRSQPVAPRSTLPVTKWPKPATQSSSAAWKRSVPTIFAAVSGKATIISEPEEGARADRGEPDDEAAEDADQDRDHLVAAQQQERRVAAVGAQERLDEEADAADHERDPEHLLGGALVPVAVAMREPRRQRHPEQRGGRRADQHPHREPCVDVPELAVPRGAERLEDRAVEDVGADRHRRLEAEDEDQHRRHQRAATHAGHPDEQADQQTGE